MIIKISKIWFPVLKYIKQSGVIKYYIIFRAYKNLKQLELLNLYSKIVTDTEWPKHWAGIILYALFYPCQFISVSDYNRTRT